MTDPYDRNEVEQHNTGEWPHWSDTNELEEEIVCANCGHDKESHWDRYGCMVEGGDVWVDGENCGGWVAQGPCGCKDWIAEGVK